MASKYEGAPTGDNNPNGEQGGEQPSVQISQKELQDMLDSMKEMQAAINQLKDEVAELKEAKAQEETKEDEQSKEERRGVIKRFIGWVALKRAARKERKAEREATKAETTKADAGDTAEMPIITEVPTRDPVTGEPEEAGESGEGEGGEDEPDGLDVDPEDPDDTASSAETTVLPKDSKVQAPISVTTGKNSKGGKEQSKNHRVLKRVGILALAAVLTGVAGGIVYYVNTDDANAAELGAQRSEALTAAAGELSSLTSSSDIDINNYEQAQANLDAAKAKVNEAMTAGSETSTDLDDPSAESVEAGEAALNGVAAYQEKIDAAKKTYEDYTSKAAELGVSIDDYLDYEEAANEMGISVERTYELCQQFGVSASNLGNAESQNEMRDEMWGENNFGDGVENSTPEEMKEQLIFCCYTNNAVLASNMHAYNEWKQGGAELYGLINPQGADDLYQAYESDWESRWNDFNEYKEALANTTVTITTPTGRACYSMGVINGHLITTEGLDNYNNEAIVWLDFDGDGDTDAAKKIGCEFQPVAYKKIVTAITTGTPTYNNTPSTPSTPSTPDTPNTPDEPGEPDEPDEPDDNIESKDPTADDAMESDDPDNTFGKSDADAPISEDEQVRDDSGEVPAGSADGLDKNDPSAGVDGDSTEI